LPLNVVIFSVVPDAAEEAALGAELLAELVEPDDELPHAARTKAAAANPAGAHHLPRIASLRSSLTASNTPDHVAIKLSVHHKRECFGRARSGRSRMAA
jgi:hypothetical protein